MLQQVKPHSSPSYQPHPNSPSLPLFYSPSLPREGAWGESLMGPGGESLHFTLQRYNPSIAVYE